MAAVADEVESLGQAVMGAPIVTDLPQLRVDPLSDLVKISARCAIDEALFDLQGQISDRSIARILSPAPAARVPCYANINRRTTDRSPEGFAAAPGPPSPPASARSRTRPSMI